MDVKDELLIKRGFLSKEGSHFKTWKRRFFILNGLTLLYYDGQEEHTPKGAVLLDGCLVRDADKKSGRPCSFEIYGPGRSFLVQADDEKAKVEWVSAIDHNIHFSEKLRKKFTELEKQSQERIDSLEVRLKELLADVAERKAKEELETKSRVQEVAEHQAALKACQDQIAQQTERIREFDEKNLALEKQIQVMKSQAFTNAPRPSLYSASTPQAPGAIRVVTNNNSSNSLSAQSHSSSSGSTTPTTTSPHGSLSSPSQAHSSYEMEIAALKKELGTFKMAKKLLKAEVLRLTAVVNGKQQTQLPQSSPVSTELPSSFTNVPSLSSE